MSNLFKTNESSLSAGLNFSTYDSKFQSVPDGARLLIGPGGPLQNPIISNQIGESVGSIYAPQYSGQNTELGFPLFEDLNGDGIITTAPSLFSPEEDFVNLGTGFPDFELGCQLYYRKNGWRLASNIRGAFGYVLINRLRQFHEPIGPAPVLNNFILNDLGNDGLSRSLYSSHFVEDANFLMLDQVTLSKEILAGKKTDYKFLLSLTAENILLSSKYSGQNPEPVLEDVYVQSYRAG